MSSGPSRPPLQPFLSTPFANYLTSAQLTTFSIYFTELTFTPFLHRIPHGRHSRRLLHLPVRPSTRLCRTQIPMRKICRRHHQHHYHHIRLARLTRRTANNWSTSPLPRHTCSLHAITTTRLPVPVTQEVSSNTYATTPTRVHPAPTTLLLPFRSPSRQGVQFFCFYAACTAAYVELLYVAYAGIESLLRRCLMRAVWVSRCTYCRQVN